MPASQMSHLSHPKKCDIPRHSRHLVHPISTAHRLLPTAYRLLPLVRFCQESAEFLSNYWHGWWILSRHRPSKLTGKCRICRYDLTSNVSGVCPECGTPVPKEAADNKSPRACLITGQGFFCFIASPLHCRRNSRHAPGGHRTGGELVQARVAVRGISGKLGRFGLEAFAKSNPPSDSVAKRHQVIGGDPLDLDAPAGGLNRIALAEPLAVDVGQKMVVSLPQEAAVDQSRPRFPGQSRCTPLSACVSSRALASFAERISPDRLGRP